MPELPVGPSGYLLLLNRTFDSRPLGFYSDRAQAEEAARSILAAYDPHAPAGGQPETGRGDLGPLGVFSRVLGIALVPYAGGRPVAEGRCYFSPEVPERGRGTPGPAGEGASILDAHGISRKKPRKRKDATNA